MQFYGTGTQKQKGLDGEVVYANVLIPLTETSRVGAVKQAERIARKGKIKLDGVYVAGGSRKDNGGILTKNMKRQKASKR